VFAETDRDNIARKLGLRECRNEDIELMQSLHGLMHAAEVDMTLFFRALANIDLATPSLAPLRASFYDEAKMRRAEADFDAWLARYVARIAEDGSTNTVRRARMLAANPKFVLRNYLAQQAIDRADRGDEAGIAELLDVMRHPYDEQPGRDQYAQRRPDWARDRAGCSMLSCSS